MRPYGRLRASSIPTCPAVRQAARHSRESKWSLYLSTLPLTAGSALRSKVSAGQQLPPLGGSSSGPGSSSLEGGKSVLFKEARAKFLDPLGRPLPAADSSRTLLPAAQFLSAPGGSAASVPSEWGAGSAAAGNSTTK